MGGCEEFDRFCMGSWKVNRGDGWLEIYTAAGSEAVVAAAAMLRCKDLVLSGSDGDRWPLN